MKHLTSILLLTLSVVGFTGCNHGNSPNRAFMHNDSQWWVVLYTNDGGVLDSWITKGQIEHIDGFITFETLEGKAITISGTIALREL
jgi:hypothetical protein